MTVNCFDIHQLQLNNSSNFIYLIYSFFVCLQASIKLEHPSPTKIKQESVRKVFKGSLRFVFPI